MPTAEKQRIIEETAESIREIRGIYLADFSGMDVAQITKLRRRCFDQEVRFRVLKNTLLKRAFHAQGIQSLDAYLEGPTGLVFSPNSEVAPAKILTEFAKEHERPRIKAAVVDGKLFDEKQVAALASLPSREVLLGQVLATLIAPMTQFLAAIEATVALPAVMADVLARERTTT